MSLLASCLLFVVLPQEPTPAAPTPATPAVETADTTAPAVEPVSDQELLATLEQAGAAADPAALAQLTRSNDATVAVRAAWLAARLEGKDTLTPLHAIVASSQHADARVHAMQAIVTARNVASVECAIGALRDADRRVRTLAAQLLGKLQKPAATEPLLALLDDSRTKVEPGDATDLQAALLALHDLGAKDHLLRAATAIHDGKAEATGTALAFCCQNLVPKLDQAEQTTFLLAVLGHREPLVRRYAIGRLAELEDPTTAKALEGRLGRETKELRPLLEVAIAQVRKDKAAPPSDELQRATHNARALVHTAQTWWNGASMVQRGAAVGAPVLLIAAVVLLVRRRRNRVDAASAAATMALVQPSEEYLQQAADEEQQYTDEQAEVVAEDGATAEEQHEDVAAR